MLTDRGSRELVTQPHARETTARRIAAIDVGSNSIRQIIADVRSDGSIEVVDELKAHPRLGRGLEASGALNTDSMDLAVDALQRMALLAKRFGAERVEAVATSAVREAENGEFFVARVKQATGLRLRILKGEDEARLMFRSALAHFDLGAGRTVVLDIGGGSLEIALAAEGVVDRLASLPLGAIRMTERYGTPEGLRMEKLRRRVRKQLKPVVSRKDWRGARVIGSGGTFTNLAGLHLHRQGIFSAKSVHGTVIPRTEVEHILDWLAAMSDEERRATPGLNADRADIIVAGVAVIAEVLARVDARELVVSRFGIREGLLLESARVAPVVADPGEGRERSIRELAERCHYEKKHALAVREIALRLFDGVAPRLGLGPEDRQVLADAALVHDIGYHINYDRHHKHSYHLILHADLLGVTPEEQVLIANVARYHRGTEPRRKHANYGGLDRALRQRVKTLSAILRVADGLDRGHVGAVDGLKLRWMDRALRITPVPIRADAPLRLECWGAHRKSGLLADVIGKPVEIVTPDGTALSSTTIVDAARA
jgi:exopolyphosphatase/guanosine-5'-triphosphate,3'-diphosphate pyrophosphatase